MSKVWLALLASCTYAALISDSDPTYLSVGVPTPSGSIKTQAEQTEQHLQSSEALHEVQQHSAPPVSELLNSSSGSKQSSETTESNGGSDYLQHVDAAISTATDAPAKTVRRSSKGKASKSVKMWVSHEGETHTLDEPLAEGVTVVPTDPTLPPPRSNLEDSLHKDLHTSKYLPHSSVEGGGDKVPLPHAILSAMSGLVRVRDMIAGSDNYIMVNLMIAVLCCLVCCPLFLRLYFLLPLPRAEPVSVEEALASTDPTSSRGSGGSGGSRKSRRTTSRTSRAGASGGTSDANYGKALTPRGRRGREPPNTNQPEPTFMGDPKRPPSTPPMQMASYGHHDERPSSTDHGSEVVSGRPVAAASAASTKRGATRSRGTTPSRGASAQGTRSRGATPTDRKTHRTVAQA